MSWLTDQEQRQLQLNVQRLIECNKNLEQRLAQLEPPQAHEKRYRDVTAECEAWTDGCGWIYLKHEDLFIKEQGGYRLRKVPYDTIRIKRTDERPEDCITPGSAFIVEREEP